ncbi:DNA topoisomerase [Phascolomyces articulosus]|uniref:DNA topoisomerase n=1 Tax=Phascolomyces articulosus TaxID=60185 RepID=A0AAD5PJC0_9FUNG|nr:DNA topoisomerase [Phascolomyces articulosus]
MTMTALLGHVLELDFGPENKSWHLDTIEDLFNARVSRNVPEKLQSVADNIQQQARNAEVLFIWTDCDREGEAIGAEVEYLCTQVNPRMEVWRARFSAMQDRPIHHAANNHDVLDRRQINAVRARSELDLRIGAAFTRLQTLLLRQYFHNREKVIISYGSCQFPTLGFVVDRYMAIKNFVSEEFWKIDMEYASESYEKGDGNSDTVKFNWKRGHLFDYWCAFVLYEKCYKNPMATVKSVQKKRVTKRKPLPLTTVELQKTANRALNISGDRIMQIAEDLYRSGLISYPRTETDEFDKNFEFMPLIQMQTNDRVWGNHAQFIRDGDFERPRNGGHNDKAHPPIHPTGYDQNLSGDQRRVYEFVVRRFLACCWKDAVGHETLVAAQITSELFDAKGLIITERNYLQVYPYDKWSTHTIPDFEEGQQFMPSSLFLNSGKTEAPKLLTEYDLIGLMEKNEIGTDATIAEHIKKILDRRYAYKTGQYFNPSTLGIALVLGYDEIGFETSLSKPFLRREMEADLKQICQGTKDSQRVLQQSIQRYGEMFQRTTNDFNKLRYSMDTYFDYGEYLQNVARNNTSNQNNGLTEGGENTSSGGGRGRGRGSRGRGSRGGNTGQGRGSGMRGGSTSRGRDRGRGRGRGSSSNRTDNSNIPNCECGLSAVERTVIKDGANKGRKFHTCSKPQNEQCGYFNFLD